MTSDTESSSISKPLGNRAVEDVAEGVGNCHEVRYEGGPLETVRLVVLILCAPSADGLNVVRHIIQTFFVVCRCQYTCECQISVSEELQGGKHAGNASTVQNYRRERDATRFETQQFT